jgi:hypothetical protein
VRRRPGSTRRSGHFVGSSLALGAAAANIASRVLIAEPAYPGLRELVRRFHRAVVQGGPSPIGDDESIDVARMRDALIAVARMRDAVIAERVRRRH